MTEITARIIRSTSKYTEGTTALKCDERDVLATATINQRLKSRAHTPLAYLPHWNPGLFKSRIKNDNACTLRLIIIHTLRTNVSGAAAMYADKLLEFSQFSYRNDMRHLFFEFCSWYEIFYHRIAFRLNTYTSRSVRYGEKNFRLQLSERLAIHQIAQNDRKHRRSRRLASSPSLPTNLPTHVVRHYHLYDTRSVD